MSVPGLKYYLSLLVRMNCKNSEDKYKGRKTLELLKGIIVKGPFSSQFLLGTRLAERRATGYMQASPIIRLLKPWFCFGLFKAWRKHPLMLMLMSLVETRVNEGNRRRLRALYSSVYDSLAFPN